MPPPEVRKGPSGPQDEPEGRHAANPPSPPHKPSTERPEPLKDDEGKPIVAPVAESTSAIPHEADDEGEDDEVPLDVTVPGGRYQVGDKIVNAEGEVLEDAPKAAAKKKKK